MTEPAEKIAARNPDATAAGPAISIGGILLGDRGRLPAALRVPAARKNRSVLTGLSFAWLALIILAAIFANVLPLRGYSAPIDLAPRTGLNWSREFLGTDALGRSELSRVIFGARVPLVIGTISGLAGSIIGSVIGLLAGYYGKWADTVVGFLADVLLAFPPLILLLAFTSIVTPSVTSLSIVLSVVVIPNFIRLSRANTVRWKQREFIRAARNMGAGDLRIMSRELVPNLLPSLVAYLPVVIAALIVAEGSLSFLGLGIPPPTPTWGQMISDGKDFLTESPHLVFVPAAFLYATVFSLNQAGDYLRLRFDRTTSD